MVFVYPELSRTFNEYLLLPNLTTKHNTIENVSLKTPLSRFHKGEEPDLSLNIPFVSAIMQSVSDNNLGIALAKNGGLSFIYGSQSIETQVDMITKIKKYKAGFVISDTKQNQIQNLLAERRRLHNPPHRRTNCWEFRKQGLNTGCIQIVITTRPLHQCRYQRSI